MADCTPGEPIYDLSGNVWEWEDACGTNGPNDPCLLRGGCFISPEEHMRCDFQNITQGRSYRNTTIGFRCCAD
jgi:formylglycine-generating enzyme required for sulfatase activity